MNVNIPMDAMRDTTWNRSCHFSVGEGRLGRGLGPELQDRYTYDHYDGPEQLHGFHPLSEDYIGQDCRGSRLSHTGDVGMAGFDMAERLW